MRGEWGERMSRGRGRGMRGYVGEMKNGGGWQGELEGEGSGGEGEGQGRRGKRLVMREEV